MASKTVSDEDAIRAIHQQMIDAWNAGDGSAFAAPFTDDADFITFEGTHLKGRRNIALFNQRIFDTVRKGTRLEGEVKFVRIISPVIAMMHSAVRVLLPGQTAPSPVRQSAQLSFFTKHDGEWRIEGFNECSEVDDGTATLSGRR
jgi:uncharacterized protein (TIGR02246 family)